MFELDPNNVYKYQSQLPFQQGALIRLSIVDQLVAIHNLDEKTSQLFDLKITEYFTPLLQPNLTIDTRSVQTKYLSESFLPEEVADTQFQIKFALDQSNEESSPDVTCYDETAHFIAPHHIINVEHLRSLCLKLSLEKLISCTKDMSMLLLSMVNRSNNKRILMKLANNLILNKRLSLIGISKFFNKMNQIYKQAG